MARTARPAPAAQLALFDPTVPGTAHDDAQLDLVAYAGTEVLRAGIRRAAPGMAHDSDAPAAVRRMADELAAATGVPMRATSDGAITSAPAPARVEPAATLAGARAQRTAYLLSL
jgi:hypothetical protein